MDNIQFPAKSSDMTENALNNGRFSNRAARFYWADEEPSPRAYSIQQIAKSYSDSHFEESPLVIAAISAGVIGVAIIIIILVGIWIRSRLFTEVQRRGSNSENPTNVSARSSMSTLDEDAYIVCMEMGGTVLGSMHNVADNYCANDATIEMEPKGEESSPNTVTEKATIAATDEDQCELPNSNGQVDLTHDIINETCVNTKNSLDPHDVESTMS